MEDRGMQATESESIYAQRTGSSSSRLVIFHSRVSATLSTHVLPYVCSVLSVAHQILLHSAFGTRLTKNKRGDPEKEREREK